MTHENVSVHITLSCAKQTKIMCPCTGHFQRSHVKAEKGRGGRAGGGGGGGEGGQGGGCIKRAHKMNKKH